MVNLRYSGPPTEIAPEFLQGMVDRMEVSYHKYGAVADAYPFKVSALDSLKQRLREYEKTGNTEFLIDAANFAMIEFMRPAKFEAHFTPTDETGSPGRKDVSGGTTHARNDEVGT